MASWLRARAVVVVHDVDRTRTWCAQGWWVAAVLMLAIYICCISGSWFRYATVQGVSCINIYGCLLTATLRISALLDTHGRCYCIRWACAGASWGYCRMTRAI